MTAPKLKPCPFCRGGITTIEGKGQLWRGQSYGEPQYFQLDHFGQLSETDPFPRCRVEFRCRTEAEAITAWNTRADLIDMDVLARVEAKLSAVLEACDRAKMHPRPGCGAGGMTIEANIRGSVYSGVDAWPVEEARDALTDLRAMMEAPK